METCRVRRRLTVSVKMVYARHSRLVANSAVPRRSTTCIRHDVTRTSAQVCPHVVICDAIRCTVVVVSGALPPCRLPRCRALGSVVCAAPPRARHRRAAPAAAAAASGARAAQRYLLSTNIWIPAHKYLATCWCNCALSCWSFLTRLNRSFVCLATHAGPDHTTAAASPSSTIPTSNSTPASASASAQPVPSPPRRAAISALGASALHYTIAYPFRAATLRALQRAFGGSDNAAESNAVNFQRGIVNANGNGNASGSSSVGSSVRTQDSQRSAPPHPTQASLRLDTAGLARLLCATAAPAVLPLAANERDECLVALLLLLYIRCANGLMRSVSAYRF
jgi:hypothetical protein